MNDHIKKVIKTSYLIEHKGIFVYAKVRTAPAVDKHFLITKDSDEITVITRKENLSELDIIEQSSTERVLLEIQFSPDTPDGPGFLAAITTELAKQGMSISVISTFSKDYLIFHKEDAEKGIQLLKNLGFLEK